MNLYKQTDNNKLTYHLEKILANEKRKSRLIEFMEVYCDGERNKLPDTNEHRVAVKETEWWKFPQTTIK